MSGLLRDMGLLSKVSPEISKRLLKSFVFICCVAYLIRRVIGIEHWEVAKLSLSESFRRSRSRSSVKSVAISYSLKS